MGDGNGIAVSYSCIITPATAAATYSMTKIHNNNSQKEEEEIENDGDDGGAEKEWKIKSTFRLLNRAAVDVDAFFLALLAFRLKRLGSSGERVRLIKSVNDENKTIPNEQFATMISLTKRILLLPRSKRALILG